MRVGDEQLRPVIGTDDRVSIECLLEVGKQGRHRDTLDSVAVAVSSHGISEEPSHRESENEHCNQDVRNSDSCHSHCVECLPHVEKESIEVIVDLLINYSDILRESVQDLSNWSHIVEEIDWSIEDIPEQDVMDSLTHVESSPNDKVAANRNDERGSNRETDDNEAVLEVLISLRFIVGVGPLLQEEVHGKVSEEECKEKHLPNDDDKGSSENLEVARVRGILNYDDFVLLVHDNASLLTSLGLLLHLIFAFVLLVLNFAGIWLIVIFLT